ncbi:TPA: hypothetical protein MCI85_005581, partial [Klebsiella pneumoniae]|nr:hypothetical protein [Klebsiella pneumoniae]
KSRLTELGYKEADLIFSSEVNGFTIGNDGAISEVEGNRYGVNAFLFDNVINDIENKADLLYTYLEEGL